MDAKQKLAIPGFKPAANIAAETNLLLNMPPEKVAKLTGLVHAGLRRDYSSCKEWQQNAARWIKIALQVMERKDTPWPNASNVKFPLVTMAALQFVATAYPLLVQTPHMVRCHYGNGVPEQTRQAGEKVCDHLSWQLLEGMPDWESDTDRLLFVIAIVGTCFRKTFWNPLTDSVDSTIILPNALICDYAASSVQSAARVSHMFDQYRHEFLDNVRAGVYANIDPGPASPLKKEANRPYNSSESDQQRGIVQLGEADETATPYAMAEQCVRFDVDGDGYDEPVLVTIVLDSNTIVRVQRDYTERDIHWADNERRTLLRIDRQTMYTGYHFIPNYHSSVYSLGFGQLVGPVNAATNTIFNQLTDSGTAAIARGGLLARGVNLPVGVTLTGPGMFHKTDMPAEQLANAAFQLPVSEPSDTLFKLLGLLIDVGRQLSSTMDPQIGENPGQNQPATTTLAVIEQGIKVFKSIYKRVHKAFKQEIAVMAKLNQLYLTTSFFIDRNGDEASIGAEDYVFENVRFTPYTDPNMVSATASLVRQRAVGELIPLGTINRQEYTRRTLEAMRETGIDALMAPEPATEDVKLTIARIKSDTEKLKTILNADHQFRQTQHEAVKDMAVALLAVAKAESEEKNRDVNELAIKLDALGRIVDTGAQAHTAQFQQQDPQQQPVEGEANDTLPQ